VPPDALYGSYWYIFIRVPLRNLRERGCVGASGQTAWRRGLTARGGGGSRETLKSRMPNPGRTPNGLGRLTREVVADPCTLVQHMLLAPLVVETLATANVETRPKFQEH
jgi:hypothetical protein